MLARLRTVNLVSLLLALILTCSPALASPAGQKSKSRKSTAAKSKKVSKKKTSSRSSKKIASKRRSKKVGRARSRPSSRSRRRANPSYTRTPIHDYLTSVWASPPVALDTAVQSSQEAPANASLNPMPAAVERPAPAATNQQDSVAPDGSEADPIMLNPLLAAYSDSLAARGYSVENQGFIVETMDGEVLAEHNADQPFNPASVAKVATSLAAISKLGPDFQFRTSLYTDGTLDPETGTLKGSLYIIGSGDPAFFYENALLIADKLNNSGIRAIEGNLVVLGNFYFNFSSSREASARAFRATLTPETWTAGAKMAFTRFLSMRAAEERANGSAGQRAALNPSGAPPSLSISGETITNPAIDTSRLSLLAVHTSLPLLNVLKGLNDFSNNWMASVIGSMVGGPPAVERFLKTQIGLQDEECRIVTSSGLGSNQISPRATVQILRKLTVYLKKYGLGLERILPVAGIDAGTLQRRFTDAYRGSVVAKTGTLSGVSALAGIAYTRGRGPLFFVIYNRRGSSARFRTVQDETIKKLITLFGGPAPVRYIPRTGPYVSKRDADGEEHISPAVSSPE
ncbi:MAG: D-alanyl-D-alanine carboxypeptidase [Blastocatellia bacterium]|nr:D-alanyl-D-alanine carboxypeptidase [Blastocatellia bacterium]